MNCNQISGFDWRNALNELLAGKKDALISNPEFTDHAFDASEKMANTTEEDKFALLMGEAEKTLQMIEPYLGDRTRLMEIGGGVGLVYALLRSKGYDIVSLEPGANGFGDRHRAGLHLMNTLGIDPGGWIKTGIEDFTPTQPAFDLIFSYFTLEHLPDLEKAFQVMERALHNQGLMIHCCPNYNIPFEPHYNIPLIPVKPEWTASIFPGLKNKGLWQGLNFTTTQQISRLCGHHGLRPVFCRGMTAWAFERVLSDPIFAARKKGFIKPARLLKKLGLLKVIRYCLPPSFDTPMQFTARKTKKRHPKQLKMTNSVSTQQHRIWTG